MLYFSSLLIIALRTRGDQRGGIGARDEGGAVGVGLRAVAGADSGIGCGVSGTDI